MSVKSINPSIGQSRQVRSGRSVALTKGREQTKKTGDPAFRASTSVSPQQPVSWQAACCNVTSEQHTAPAQPSSTSKQYHQAAPAYTTTA